MIRVVLVSLISAASFSFLFAAVWPFYPFVWGSIVSALLTSASAGPLQTLVGCLYAHPNIRFSACLKFFWLFPFVLYCAGHALTYTYHGTSFYVQREVWVGRWVLFAVAWITMFFLCDRVSRPEPRENAVLLTSSKSARGEENGAIASFSGSGLGYVFCVSLAICTMIMAGDEWFPDSYLGAAASAEMMCVYLVSWHSMRNKIIQYDAACLLFSMFALTAGGMSMLRIFRLGDLVGPVYGSIILAGWKALLLWVLEGFCDKITTSADSMLFLFPHRFAVDLVQALFFTADSLSLDGLQFWLLLFVQEARSLIVHTGLSAWVIHKSLVAIHKRMEAENPFSQNQFEDIRKRALIDSLSEQLSTISVVCAILGGTVASSLGAHITGCQWFEIKDLRTVLVGFAVVVGVRFFGFLIEEILLWFVGRRLKLPQSVTVVEKPSLLVAVILGAGSILQILSVS